MLLMLDGLIAETGDKTHQCLPSPAGRGWGGRGGIFASWSRVRPISHGFLCRLINQSMFPLKVHGL